MKRKPEEMDDGEGPPPPIRTYMVPPPPTYINSSIPPPTFINSSVPPPQNYITRGRGVWQPRVPQGSMRGVAFHGVIRGGGPYFRGLRMPANNRGYFRGRGRVGPIRYNSYENYDNSYQEYVPLPPWTDPHGYQPEQQTQNYYQKPVWNQQPQQQQQPPPFQQQELQQHGENALEQESENPAATGDETYTKAKVGKRRPMSQSYPSRPWNKEDAERALREETLQMKGLRNQSLIIRFPDPELSKDIVKSFHPAIDNVHFQVPSGARYCFVQLSDTVNPEKTIKVLEQIKFGSGKLTVEKKFTKDEEDLSPEAIDPYTLYIGNLPTNVNVASVKEKFPTATRIDIGFAQRMKFTRYAFIRYNTVDEAIEAYRQTHNLVLDSRSIIVRFRRQRGHVGLPGESKPQKPVKEVEKVTKVKIKKEKTEKPKEVLKKEKKEVMNDEEDDEDDEEDDEVDDDDDEDDDDDDDDEDEDEDAEEDDEDDEDEDEADEVANVDDPDDPDDDDDDEDDDDDDENEDQSGNLFQQIDSQIVDLDGINLNYLRK